MSELYVYKASAGSGKTYNLTLEYFRIIFKIPTEYKNILAVTFTNKATEEMKSRILSELNNLANNQESSYKEVLKREFNLSDNQVQNRALELRNMLLHNYGRISVTTIDRFFQRIVKSFTRELGIYPGYNVELDNDYILEKAVSLVLWEVKRKSNLRAWISDLMNESVEDGKSWSVKARMMELGEELFKENYMLFGKDTLEKFQDKDFLKSYRIFLNGIVKEFETTLQRCSEQAIKLMQDNNLSLTDFKGGIGGAAGYFFKVQRGDFDNPTLSARKGCDHVEAWILKDCYGELREKLESVYPQLSKLLRMCVELYDTQYRYYVSARQLMSNLYCVGILDDISKKVRTFCDEKGLMLLSDTNHILNILIAGNNTPFVFEKLGSTYKHVMIDEFQDTSSMQWQNFKPLVENSLSEGNKAVIVGDVKQSIYRWRNGDWHLLANGVQNEFAHLGIQEIVLPDNWRSSQEVVDFNNVFFRRGAQELKALYDQGAGEDNRWSDEITEAYKKLEQSAQREDHGYVDVRFGPEKKEENADHLIMEDMVSIIQHILERGGSLKEVVILVRSGKEGAFVANYLMDYNKRNSKTISFVSNDSLYASSSPSVRFLVAVLKYLIDPYDIINKSTILYLYYTYIQPAAPEGMDRVFKAARCEDIFQFIHADLSTKADKIMLYSLFETVEAIIEKFVLKNRKEEIPYLIAFQDIIFEYEAGNSNNITQFLEWWDKEQNKRVLATSENIDALRILTIHKSKGLEFNHVLLPFCNWELDSIIPIRRIWCSNREEKFKELDYAPLNYSSRLADTIFQDAYFEEHLKAYVDNLNLLYVALTRAKKELYIRPYSPKMNKDGSFSISGIGSFIYQVLKELKNHPGCQFIPDDGMNVVYGKQLPLAGIIKNKEIPISIHQYPIYDVEGRLSIKYRYKDFIEPGEKKDSPLDTGKLLHEIFKSVKYREDIPLAVRSVYMAGYINKTEIESYTTCVREYIRRSRVTKWFKSPGQVITEREILLKMGEKVRPDRVMRRKDAIEIVDYKFGLLENDTYIKQVQNYCHILREMEYLPVKGYVWYVRLNKVIEV